MRRFPFTIIIFITSIAICIGGLAFIKTKKDHYSNLLHSAYTQAKQGDLSKAQEITKKFKKTWDKNEKFLMLFIHREDLGEIAFSARAIKEYIEMKELPEFYAELKRIMALLDHLWETETPLLQNIL